MSAHLVRDTLTVRRCDILSPEAGAIIGALNAELRVQYPEPGANHFRLDADEVAPGRGAFLVAWRDGRPVGCGAVRRIDEDAGTGPGMMSRTGEIKRMYVAPEERRRGVARAILAAIEAAARELGLTRLVLETGTRQTEAIALYLREGFSHIPPFGEYTGPLSVCMGKDI